MAKQSFPVTSAQEAIFDVALTAECIVSTVLLFVSIVS